MATPSQVSYALQLIDRYIDQLQDWEIKGAYDKNIKDFFLFVKEYGANKNDVIDIIKSAIGFTPKQIRDRSEAEEIRELLRGTLTSDYLGRRIKSSELKKPQSWAEDSISFAFGEKDSDPYEKNNEY